MIDTHAGERLGNVLPIPRLKAPPCSGSRILRGARSSAKCWRGRKACCAIPHRRWRQEHGDREERGGVGGVFSVEEREGSEGGERCSRSASGGGSDARVFHFL